MKNTIDYFIFTDIIKKSNRHMIEYKPKEEIDNKIVIKKKENNLEYEMDDKILKEYFYTDGNSLNFSIIKFTGDFYDNELIGFKFFYDNNNLMLIKYPFHFYPEFIFYDLKNEDALEIIKKHLLEKIDYNKNEITGYKVYIFFYLYSLLNAKKAELETNKIIIKIIDEDIDPFILNYINEAKSKKNKNDYIFIFFLLFKEHIGTLFYINDKYYLYDSSYSFVSKLDKIFHTMTKDIKILNSFIIQNLGSCLFHNISFLETILSYISVNGKELFSAKIDVIFKSQDFIFNYINNLNDLCGYEKVKIITNKIEDSNNYFLLDKDIYLSKKSFKFRYIDYDSLFEFLELKTNKLVDLILKENYIYKNCFQINKLYNELIMLFGNKIDDIDKKVLKIYNEKCYELKYNNIFLKDEIINTYFDCIVNKFNIKEELKLELKIKIKEEIRQEFNINEIEFPQESSINDKSDINSIIKLIEKKLESEIYYIYCDEYLYYTDLYETYIKEQENFIKFQKEIVIKFENFNNNQKLDLGEFNPYLNKNKEKLDNTLNELKGLINVFN